MGANVRAPLLFIAEFEGDSGVKKTLELILRARHISKSAPAREFFDL